MRGGVVLAGSGDGTLSLTRAHARRLRVSAKDPLSVLGKGYITRIL